MTLLDDMAAIDLEVLTNLGEEFEVDGEPVVGIYSKDFIERPGGENFVEGYELSFICRLEDLPGGLVQQETVVTHPTLGAFRYLRHEPDESGLTRVVLGAGT